MSDQKIPSNTETVPLEEFFSEVLPKLRPDIQQFTTPLFYRKNSRGSGVLVVAGGHHGILTASHSIHAHGGINFDKNNIQLLQFSLLDKPNGYGIPINELVEIKIGEPNNLSYTIDGPDLTFIRIPNQHVGSIKAYKSFLNLDIIHDQDRSYDLDGNCVFSGFPEG